MQRRLPFLILSASLPVVLFVLFLGIALRVGSARAGAQAPQQLSLSLAMTVGTDPAVCAALQTLHLPVGGGDVTYCYEVTNTGDMTLSRHTLVDAQLGTLLLHFPFNLGPGASFFLTFTETITMTTVSSATWTAYNPGVRIVASDTDEAIVIVGHRIYLPLVRRE